MVAKCLKSIYFPAEVILEAEKKELDINSICVEALSTAINENSNIGAELKRAAELSKDNQVMLRLSLKRNSSLYKERWIKAVQTYAFKYNLEIAEVLKKFSF